jgi:hypothetical protein
MNFRFNRETIEVEKVKIKQILILVIIFGLTFTINAFSQEKKKLEPVNWEELKAFLIDISGFIKEGEPVGEIRGTPNNKLSRVKQDYVAESDKNKRLTLAISDFGFPSEAIEMSKSIWEEVDTSEKYIKRITIKNCPGVESYRYNNKEARVIVIIEDRFIVRLEGFGFDDTSELKNIIQKIDFKGIASLR